MVNARQLHRSAQRTTEKVVTQWGFPQTGKVIEKIRRVEGILRRWSYEGETVLPDDPAPYYRVAVRCGFNNPEKFREFLSDCRRAIREVYSKALAAP